MPAPLGNPAHDWQCHGPLNAENPGEWQYRKAYQECSRCGERTILRDAPSTPCLGPLVDITDTKGVPHQIDRRRIGKITVFAQGPQWGMTIHIPDGKPIDVSWDEGNRIQGLDYAAPQSAAR